MTATKIDRSRLPDPGAARPFSFPSIDKSVLSSGLQVWSVRHAAVPIVSYMLLVRSGSSSDPDGKEGLAAIAADMLDEGSGDRSAIGMHEALARIGAQFDTDIGADAALVSITTLAKCADRGLRLLADIVARPSLTEADFARVRQLRLHRLTQLRDVPGAVADRTFMRLLYGSHPYGHTPMGTEESVATLTVDDVRQFHANAIRPDTATLDRRRRLRSRGDRAPGGGCVRRLARSAHGRRLRCRDRPRHRHTAVAPAGSSSSRGRARRSRSSGSVTSPSRGTRPITMRWSPPTWCSAASSSAAST